MNIKTLIAAGIFVCALLVSASASAGCQQPDRIGNIIDLRDGRKISIVEQSMVDNVAQSNLRQKLLLLEGGQSLTPENARVILIEIFDRAKAACRRYPLSNVIMFLYGSKDAIDGTNWIARLNTRNGMTPSIDVNPVLLSKAASSSACDNPNTPKPKGIDIQFPDEVILPPLKQRKVLGTWALHGTCSRSFEEVKGRIYEVIRCAECSGGDTGTPLVKKSGNTYTRPDRRNGEYFKILPNGNIGVYDRDGLIDTDPRLSRLWP